MKALLVALVMSAFAAAPVAFAQTSDEVSALINDDQSLVISINGEPADQSQFDTNNFDFQRGPRGPRGPRPRRPGPGPRPPRPYPAPRPFLPRPPRPYPNPGPRPSYWTCDYRDSYNYSYVWSDWDLNRARYNAQSACYNQSPVGGCYEFQCYP